MSTVDSKALTMLRASAPAWEPARNSNTVPPPSSLNFEVRNTVKPQIAAEHQWINSQRQPQHHRVHGMDTPHYNYGGMYVNEQAGFDPYQHQNVHYSSYYEPQPHLPAYQYIAGPNYHAPCEPELMITDEEDQWMHEQIASTMQTLTKLEKQSNPEDSTEDEFEKFMEDCINNA